MRLLAFAACALVLAACGQTSREQRAGCARSATHEVVWSQAHTPDVITTSSQGPSCVQAVVTFVARDADGDPLWTFASTYYDLKIGGLPPEDAAEVSAEEMDAFLADLADVTMSRSSALPEWREGAETLTEGAAASTDGAATFAYHTPFARETYEALRARDLAMICYAAAAEATQCLVVDPASYAPTMIAAYGP